MPSIPYILACTLILLTTAFLRLIYILPALHRRPPAPRKRGTPTHLLLVLGSGGHTAEMLSLLAPLDPIRYTHRSYVLGSGDGFSAGRAEDFERGLAAKARDVVANGQGVGEEEVEQATAAAEIPPPPGDYSIHTVPRARHIHQPLLTAPLSSLACLHACTKLLRHHPHGAPDLILANGPATSLILILAATALRYFSFLLAPRVREGRDRGPGPGRGRGRGEMRVVYVESWARVRRPSLSGRIIVWCGLGDRVLVQWKGLQDRGWGEYKGVLVR